MDVIYNEEVFSDYKNPFLVNRLASKLTITKEDANLLFEDLKKFLFVSTKTDRAVAPTGKIDAAWHEFLILSRDYNNFCCQFLGSFVHHRPYNSENERLEKGFLAYKHGLSLAKQLFGTSLSDNWALSSTNKSNDHDCSPDFDCDSEGGGESDPSDWN